MIYLDTSVALAHLLAEDRAPADALWNATLISSRLLEYELWNRLNARGLRESHGAARQALLDRVALLELVPTVLTRALAPFPVAVRTLDALHLASVFHLQSQRQAVTLATYDTRMREAAEAMGDSAGGRVACRAFPGRAVCYQRADTITESSRPISAEVALHLNAFGGGEHAVEEQDLAHRATEAPVEAAGAGPEMPIFASVALAMVPLIRPPVVESAALLRKRRDWNVVGVTVSVPVPTMVVLAVMPSAVKEPLPPVESCQSSCCSRNGVGYPRASIPVLNPIPEEDPAGVVVAFGEGAGGSHGDDERA